MNYESDKPTTRRNTTGKATKADTVYTAVDTSKWIVNYFNPTGICLDPAAGGNAFYRFMPKGKRYRCEIRDGLDFFKWSIAVSWIITNPPYSIYYEFLLHSFKVANNVVFFAPIYKVFKSNKIQLAVSEYGGLKEIVYLGGGGRHGFGFGFPVGAVHYQRHWDGLCRITNHF